MKLTALIRSRFFPSIFLTQHHFLALIKKGTIQNMLLVCCKKGPTTERERERNRFTTIAQNPIAKNSLELAEVEGEFAEVEPIA